MASFPERVESREFRGDWHHFHVSDDGDLYALREMYEMNVYSVVITSGMRVLDIGAHKGIFSTWAAKQGAHVTAYEPNRKSYEVMLQNFQLNGVTVEDHQIGIGSYRTSRTLYCDPENSIGSTFYPNRIDDIEHCETQMTVMISLDEALGNDEWDVVKIDAEQSEYAMLLSSERLGQIKFLTFEWHCPGDERTHPKLLETVDKLSKFFDVPPINYDWRALAMRRK